MAIVITIITVILQAVAAQLLSFIGATLLNIGNGWELLWFAIASAVGVWGMGVVAARVRGRKVKNAQMRFIHTLIGSGIGAALLLLPFAFGFGGLLIPIVGALIGYYATALRRA